MTTAVEPEAAPTTAAPVPTANATVRNVVRSLLACDRVSIETVAETSGVPRDTLYRRVRGAGKQGFTVDEVARLATYFELPIQEFFDPSDAYLERIRKPGFFRGHDLAA